MEIGKAIREFQDLFHRKGIELQQLKDWWKTHEFHFAANQFILLWPYGLGKEWTELRPLFKGFLSFLVKECGHCPEHWGMLERLLEVMREITQHNLIEQAREEWEVIDFFASLGYNFNAPMPFYPWEYRSDSLYSSLCVRSHARLLDAGAIVPMRWRYEQLHFGAPFIYSMWEVRQEYKQCCIVLMGILRIKRPDLRRLVARELISAIGQMVWAHRWDEFSLQ